VTRSVSIFCSFAKGLIACCAMLAGSAHATAINYVSNGNFANGFNGWTVTTGAGAANPGKGPQVVVTNGQTNDGFGDYVIADNAATPDPDASTTNAHAAYFVDDVATETLSQTFYVTPGVYEVGFDLYATASGFRNKYDSLFSASIWGTTITSGNITQYGSSVWEHFAANADILTAGYYTINFNFQGGAAPAKDIMVDNVYAINPSTLPGSGTAVVPEPCTLLLLATAAGGLFYIRRRRAI
jgi:hypothetical protein